MHVRKLTEQNYLPQFTGMFECVSWSELKCGLWGANDHIL